MQSKNSFLKGLMMVFAISFMLPAMANDQNKHDYKTMVVDFIITGDSTVSGDKAENKQKIDKFSEHFRDQLQQKTRFDVISDADKLQKITQADKKQDLHNCNGCELDLAKEMGAELVILPKVFRMSHLISTMHVEFKEVESGKLIKRKSYDFRGNTDQAWERAIKYAIRDLKDWDRN